MAKGKWLRRLLGLLVGAAAATGVIQWIAAPVEAQGKRRYEPQRHDTALEGKPAPEFVLSDVYGIPRRLSAWRGMPVFLHFGSSW
jgi:hypothetical protein